MHTLLHSRILIFMNEKNNSLIRDRIVKVSNIISLIILLLTLGYSVFIYRNLPPLIPVFNQLPWGINRLAEKNMYFLPLGLSILMIFINIIFSRLMYEKMPLVVRMLSITTLFVSFITLIFILRTALLVT